MAASLSAAHRSHNKWRTAEKRFVRHVCLRNPFPPFLFRISKHPLAATEAWGPWEPQYASTTSAFLATSCQSLRCSCRKKTRLMQRGRGIGHGVVVSKICYNAVIVLSAVLCDCRKTAWISRRWVGSVAVSLQLPMFAKCDSLPKRDWSDYATCLFKESIPAIPFWNSKHPLGCQKQVLRAAVAFPPPAAFWLHHAHAGEAEKLVDRVVVSKICYNTVIVLSVVLCDCWKPMNNCRDWAFSNSGLEVWLPAFQLQMHAKCDELPKGDLFDMSCYGFLLPSSLRSSPYQKLLRGEVPPALRYNCIMPIPSLQSAEKDLSQAEIAEGLTELWFPRFGLQDTVIVLSVVTMWLLETHEQLSRLSF